MSIKPRRGKRGRRLRSAQALWLWLTGLLVGLLVASIVSVTIQPSGQARSNVPPGQSKTVAAPSPTPGSPSSIPRSLTKLPPGLDAEQPQILAELGHPAKALLVSITNQTLYIYQGDTLVNWSFITTGRPELQTPRGFYSILQRQQSVMFYSKWPPSSPYYYAPTFVHYALRFLGTDFFLHDYSPRHYYGPGTNVWHQNPDGTWEDGSHGCVETPLVVMQWLYNWATLGTPMVVY